MFSASAVSATTTPLYSDDLVNTSAIVEVSGAPTSVQTGISYYYGGLVLARNRNNGGYAFEVSDTVNGITNKISTSGVGVPGGSSLISSVGDGVINFATGVTATSDYFSFASFRQDSNFFVIKTYTGNGAGGGQTIYSGLPNIGFAIIKATSTTGNFWTWCVAGGGIGVGLVWNSDQATGTIGWSPVSNPSNGFITLDGARNTAGVTYTMYAWAHNVAAYGVSGTESICYCGQYTGNGSTTGPTVTLGWEPQFVMIKNATTLSNWVVVDSARGLSVSENYKAYTNTTGVDVATGGAFVIPTQTGFKLGSTDTQVNKSGDTYIYMAVRKGGMKPQTVGTNVFLPIYSSTGVATNTTISNIQCDLQISCITNAVSDFIVLDRLRGSVDSMNIATVGSAQVQTNNSNNQTFTFAINDWETPNFKVPSIYNLAKAVYWNFKRNYKFMDIVYYTGNGSSQSISHQLGVAPEMIWVKNLTTSSTEWAGYHTGTGVFNSTALDNATIPVAGSYWNNNAPTSSVFTVGNNASTNSSGNNYIAILFASSPYLSSVGSYSGNGLFDHKIECGFSSAARFIAIREITGIGSPWYCYDSARGITGSSDPVLFLNTGGGLSSNSYIVPYANGFSLSNSTALNGSGSDYIYFAIS